MAEIEFRDIKKSFGQTEIIKGIDLKIQKGEFMVFVGPSGSGKSTLLRLIAGLEDITSGELLFDGEVVNDLVPSTRGIAMVFQSYALYPHMDVYNNIAFGLKIEKLGAAAVKERVEEAAKMLQIDHLLTRLPKQLSGGQRQRVAIGRAIVRNPSVFLFDEPLSNLDTELRVATRLEISKLHSSMQGVTMIYVTHDQVEAMTLADRICVLRDGKIEQVGTPLELYEKPNSTFVAGFIGSPKMNLLTGELAHSFDCATVGVRPEHIQVVEEASLWNGKTVHTEDLGFDHYLFVDVGTEIPVIVRQSGQARRQVGSEVNLSPDLDKIHRFAEDGKALF